MTRISPKTHPKKTSLSREHKTISKASGKSGKEELWTTKKKIIVSKIPARENSSDSGSDSDAESSISSEEEMEVERATEEKRATKPATVISVEQASSGSENGHTDQQKRERLEKLKKVSDSICRKHLSDLCEQDFSVVKSLVADLTKPIAPLTDETEAVAKRANYSMRLTDNLHNLEGLISGVETALRGNAGRNASQGTNSYAEKLKSAITKPLPRPEAPVVAIYPSSESKIKSSEDTKATLMANIRPEKEMIKIRGVKKISNNGVLVETSSK